eukprot:c33941_g1_i1 orf=66-224(+)
MHKNCNFLLAASFQHNCCEKLSSKTMSFILLTKSLRSRQIMNLHKDSEQKSI